MQARLKRIFRLIFTLICCLFLVLFLAAFLVCVVSFELPAARVAESGGGGSVRSSREDLYGGSRPASALRGSNSSLNDGEFGVAVSVSVGVSVCVSVWHGVSVRTQPSN